MKVYDLILIKKRIKVKTMLNAEGPLTCSYGKLDKQL